MKNKTGKLIIFILIIILILINVKSIGKVIYKIEYTEYINKYAKEYKIDPYFVASVIKVESNYNKDAKSSKDAYGLMQITESTAKWAAEKMNIKDFKKEKLYDPEFNIRMGCWYIDNLKKEFDGNLDLVLAAYNGGRGNVNKWLSNKKHSDDGKNLDYIPFKETDKYVKKVNFNYNLYKYLYESKKLLPV